MRPGQADVAIGLLEEWKSVCKAYIKKNCDASETGCSQCLGEGIEMTNSTNLSWAHRYRGVIGWALLATWLIYLITLFPILDRYLALSLFTLMISALGLLGGVLALRGQQRWIRVSIAAAVLLVVRYLIYWQDIRETILIDSPGINMLAVIGEIAKSGMLIFEQRLSQGEILGATLTLINEFVMPILQLGILVIASVLSIGGRRIHHSQDTL